MKYDIFHTNNRVLRQANSDDLLLNKKELLVSALSCPTCEIKNGQLVGTSSAFTLIIGIDPTYLKDLVLHKFPLGSTKYTLNMLTCSFSKHDTSILDRISTQPELALGVIDPTTEQEKHIEQEYVLLRNTVLDEIQYIVDAETYGLSINTNAAVPDAYEMSLIINSTIDRKAAAKFYEERFLGKKGAQ